MQTKNMKRRDSFVFTICESKDDKLAAAQLVYECFVAGRIIARSGESQFGKIDGIITIAAKQNDEIVGTISNIPDVGKNSMRIERLFSKEINKMREDGFKMHEVSRLATRKGMPLGLVMALTRESLYCAMDSGVDYGVIEVAPGHKKMYTDFMLFEQFGEEKHERTIDDYGQVDNKMVAGNLWLPLRLDLRDHNKYKARLKKIAPGAFKFYFPHG